VRCYLHQAGIALNIVHNVLTAISQINTFLNLVISLELTIIKMNKFIQHSPPHPGEILHELYFEPLNLTVTEAAEKLLISRPNLSAIINGKAGISPAMAIKLSRAFNTTPHYWLNLQANYDLWYVMENDKAVKKVKALI